jgi:hypothetical protein
MKSKALNKQRDLLERALDRVWALANRDGQISAVDMSLLLDARLAGWKSPTERAARKAS